MKNQIMEPKDRTTVAIDRKYRPAFDMLAQEYFKEGDGLRFPTNEETIIRSVKEALSKRGIEFIPAPAGAPEEVPVVKVRKNGKR